MSDKCYTELQQKPGKRLTENTRDADDLVLAAFFKEDEAVVQRRREVRQISPNVERCSGGPVDLDP